MVDTCKHDIIRERYTTEVTRQEQTPTGIDREFVPVTTSIYQETFCLLCGNSIKKKLIASEVVYEKKI